MAWGRVAQVALQMVVLAILARLLAPTDFGVVSAALVVIGLSSIVSQIGLGPALIQRRELEPRHVETAFTASVLLGLALGALVWAVAPLAAAFFRIDRVAPVLRVLALTFPLQGLGLTSESLLRRDLRFRWLANRDVATYAVGYGTVGIGLAMLGYGVWALVAAQLAQVVLRTALLLVASPPRPRRLGEWAALRELLYFSGGFTIAKLANYAALQGDNLVVGRLLGPAALGLYGRAYQLMTAPAHGIGLVLDSVLFPAMAQVQDDPQRLGAAYRRGVALIALLVLPASAAVLVVAPELVLILLGPKWTSVVAPFQVLALGMLFRTSYKMSDSLARSTGAVYRRAWRQLHYAVLVVAGAAVGQLWGITGVAWGVLVAVTLNFLSMAQLSLSMLGMPWRDFWRAHVPACLLTAVLLPATWVVAAAARAAGLAPVVVAGAAAATAVGVGLAAVLRAPERFVGPDGLWILERLRPHVPALFRASRAAAPVPAPVPVSTPTPRARAK